ncbi:energy transducer TonB [Synoicihabitans lomoniglobus]|uniref:energy transducer TonB n=1 Tax=Synoicihabitans lomoniglobus TaxID=2909285 RepID=UPI003CE4746A
MRFKFVCFVTAVAILSGCATPSASSTADGSKEASSPPDEAVVDLADCTSKPVPTRQPAPFYPRNLRNEGVTGIVFVQLIVGMDGRVSSARAVRANREEFARAAEQAVVKWLFKPGTVDGKRVAVRMEVPVGFGMSTEVPNPIGTNILNN